MDPIGLDISAAPVGDPAELLGPHALRADLAKAAGSVARKCLVRLGGLTDQRYIG